MILYFLMNWDWTMPYLIFRRVHGHIAYENKRVNERKS